MPNVRRAHAKFQFTEYNYWEHIFSLLPEKDQELKKEVSDMIMNTVFFTQNTQPVPDGEFIVKNREGKKVKLSGDDLIEGTKETPKYIPVDDPEYARFFKDKLDLLDRIEKKYSGKNHEALKQEIGILRCKNQNLAKGVGYEFAPGDYIIIGTNGLQKFQDVLFDTEEAEKNGTDDRMKWKLKDPALVEKTMEEFGVTDIQRKYKEINEHNAEWAKEWTYGKRDPKKLRKIGDKFKKDIEDLDGYIKNFEQKYLEDMKRPENERRIYNITNRQDCEKNEIIIDFEHGDYSEYDRGFNGRNWEVHKQQFQEEYERQLITAELSAVRKNKSIVLPDKLEEKIDGYIEVTNAHLDIDDNHRDYKGNGFDTDAITGIRRLMDIRAEAAKTPDNKGAKKIIELADRHLHDPANAKLIEKANNINKEHTEMKKKIDALFKEVHRDGMENANRLRSMYTEKKLGGTGTLRFYRSTVAAMQYFNKDSDEEVLNGMRTLMNKPEKAPPETKKKMARELEKLFKGIMQFDNNKCEFSSYEELWTDPKHKDLAIMAGIASECETLLTQYETLMRDPASNCALDEEMYKEVKSKISLLEVAAPVCVSNKIVSSIYDSTGMADFDINNLIKRDAESVSDMYEKLHDGAFILLGSLVEISGKAIKPNEKFLNAVNKEREMLDLHPFPDEAEMNDRYKEIINKIDRAVAIDNGLIKEEPEKKNNQPKPEVQNVINEEPVAERSSEMSNQNKINLDEPEEDGYIFERSSVISSISGQNRINLDKPEEDDEPEVEEKKDSAKAEEKKEEAKDGIANEIKEPVQAEPEVKPEVPVQAEEKQEAPVQAVPEIDNVSEIDLNVLDDEELMAEEEELVAELDEIVRNEIEFDDDVEAVRKAPTKEEITLNQ